MVAVNDGTGLQYLLADHLGSTVAVTNASGTLTSQQRYLPFGEERAIPNSPILATDFGYTGQRLLDSGMGGIMDYKARFYSPSLGRFQQPDTLIPNPANPQSWNRFSYVYNNPVKYNDPTGHAISCDVEEDCKETRRVDKLSVGEYVNEKLSKYKVKLTGKNWDNFHMIAVLAAVVAVGNKLASQFTNMSSEQAFRAVYGWINIGNGLEGAQGECTDITAGGCTTNSHQINLAENNWAGDYVSTNQFLRNRNNVVHELGHAFGSHNRGLGLLVGGWEGFAPPSTPDTKRVDWRMHPCAAGEDICPSETFADMFLGWTFGMWADTDMGGVRADFMNKNMPSWVCAAANNQTCRVNP